MSALLTASDQRQGPDHHTLRFLDADGLVSLTTVDLQVGSSGASVPIRCSGNACPFVGQPGQTVRFTAHIQIRTAELTKPANLSRTATRVQFGLDSSKPSVPATIWLRFLASATLTTSAAIVPGLPLNGALRLGWNAGVPARASATVALPRTIGAIGLKVLSAPPACQLDTSGTIFTCAVGRADGPLPFTLVAMPLGKTPPGSLDLEVYDPLHRSIRMGLPARKPDPTPLDPAGMTGNYRAATTGAALNQTCKGVGGGPKTPTPCPTIDRSTGVVVWAELTWTAPAPVPVPVPAPGDPILPMLYAGTTRVPLTTLSAAVISRQAELPLLSRTATVPAAALHLLANGPVRVESAPGATGGWSLIVVWGDPTAPPGNTVRVENTLRWLGPHDTAAVAAATTTFLYDFDSMKGDLTRWTFTSSHAASRRPVASSNGARVFIAPTSGTLSPCGHEASRASKGCAITGGLLLGPTLYGGQTPPPAPRLPVRTASPTAL